MYRNPVGNIDLNQDSFQTFLGLNSFNVKYFQEMVLDTSTPISSPAVSPATASTSGYASSSAISPFAAQLSPEQQQYTNVYSPTSSSNVFGAALLPNPIAKTSSTTNINLHEQQILFRQQQQQQQLAAAEMAKQQLALAAAAAAAASGTDQQEQDEISRSLKMFAMLSAYKNGNETHQMQTKSVDTVMQEFDCNGYTSDEFNRYKQYQVAISNQLQHQLLFRQNQLRQNPPLLTQYLHNNNNADITHNNFWPLPSTPRPLSAQANSAAAAKIEYNNKRTQRRFGGGKNEKYLSNNKHCVFCENNNEPEAVVKSHAVRDALGRVLCPKLRTYVCPICKASGDSAHTIKYCPQKPIITMEDALKADSFRFSKSNYYKQHMKV